MKVAYDEKDLGFGYEVFLNIIVTKGPLKIKMSGAG